MYSRLRGTSALQSMVPLLVGLLFGVSFAAESIGTIHRGQHNEVATRSKKPMLTRRKLQMDNDLTKTRTFVEWEAAASPDLVPLDHDPNVVSIECTSSTLVIGIREARHVHWRNGAVLTGGLHWKCFIDQDGKLASKPQPFIRRAISYEKVGETVRVLTKPASIGEALPHLQLVLDQHRPDPLVHTIEDEVIHDSETDALDEAEKSPAPPATNGTHGRSMKEFDLDVPTLGKMYGKNGVPAKKLIDKDFKQ